MYRAALLITAVGLAFLPLPNAYAGSFADIGGRYEIAPSSTVQFTVPQAGGGGISGGFEQFSGVFDLHPDNVARSSVVFRLRPASVSTGQQRVDAFLRSSAVFDAAAYPVIVFRSRRVTASGDGAATIEGVLEARGKSHAETFHATLVEHRRSSITFHVTGKVLRSFYGMDVGTPIYSNVVDFDMVVHGERS